MPGTWGWLPRRQDLGQQAGHIFTLLQNWISAICAQKRRRPTHSARRLLRDGAEAGLTRSLAGYSLSPLLVQLRSYVEPGQKQARLVCIVGLSLSNDRGVLADVRGSVATIGTSQLSAVDAAAQAAVARLPAVLSQLEARDTNDRVAQR